MRFVLRMLWRETRSSWTRLVFFFLCVGLGVAAIVVLRSVLQNVRTTLTQEARSLLGADIIVQSTRPLTGDIRDRIDAVLQPFPVRTVVESVRTQTMASAVDGAGGQARLVELRGIEAGFPFYQGGLELEQGKTFSHALVANHGAVVQPELLVALGVQQGDEFLLAGRRFTIRGVIARDRLQGSGGIAFGPRVYADLTDLRATSLFGFGSRATYQVLLRTDEADTAAVTGRLREALRDDIASVRSWQTLEDRIGENLTLAENYLSLVGFAIVVLGGIGVWSVTRVIVQQKIRSVAILKCLGATSRLVLATYLLQVLLLAAIGSLLGMTLAALGLAAIPPAVLEPLGVTSVSITLSAAIQGAAVGLLVSLLFALVPLLEIRRVKPLLLLRADSSSTARRTDWQSVLATVVIAAALTAVAIWQADSLRAGAFVSAGLIVVALLLYGASIVLVRVTRPLARSTRFAVRHAVISLGRPGNQTRVVLMAVGLGCFFILSVRAVQANLLAEFASDVGESSPDLVLIDIQHDQIDSVRSVVTPFLRQPDRIVPLMRGRVVAVDGRRLQLRSLEDIRRQDGLGREFGLTFRDHLEPNEAIASGAFWTGQGAGAPLPDGVDTEVSIEKNLHDETRVGVGDVVTFDIAGERLRARVTSIRTVRWEDSQNGGFVFVLRPVPEVLARAHNYVGFLQVHDSQATRGELQRRLVASHPNVSAIDVRDIVASIREVVDNVTVGITIVGVVTLVGGGLILIGAVTMTRFQRIYEAAIYRTLGASTRMLAGMIATEYALLGGLAGVFGAAGASALSWALARYLFDIDWRPAPGLLLLGVALASAGATAVGVAASADVLVRKPPRHLIE